MTRARVDQDVSENSNGITTEMERAFENDAII